MIDNPGRFKDDPEGTVTWLFRGSKLDMRGDRFLIFREFRFVCKIWLNSYGTFSRRFGLATSLFCLLICPYWTSLLSWPRLGCCQSYGFRDPCFNLSIIGFTKMNKHLVENFLAFWNSQGRSRYAKGDQEDSPGDEVLATDQGVRGRMVRPWREADGRILILGFCSISFPRFFFYDRCQIFEGFSEK
ncbi:hypothetical protein F2Q69_00036400 [Brassica cretica]|uniref:Uncharacterized protein n=1 Tax=Brassica cretica TaxID=69181 RepID=A0A8S9SNJ6_BRACR|nr:hypothetical protein F2Q69_00036400 [Brassica cretica]